MLAPCAARRRRSTALLVCALAVLAPSAHADDVAAREQSRASFRRGVTLAEHGDYDGARDAFLEAYRLYSHPSILLNLGIARWRTGELVDAEQDLAKFLADDGGASTDEVASARATIAAVREHLGTVRLTARPASAHATLDGKPIALVPGLPVDVRAVVGHHSVAIEADGYAATTEPVDVTRAHTTTLDVTLVALVPVAHVDPIAPPDEARGTARATVGWVLAGVAVVSAGVGTYAGVRALSLARDYDDRASPDFQDPGTKSTGITLRTLSDATFAGALVLGGVGAWLILTSERAGDARAGLVVSPGFAGLRGSF